MESPKVSVIIPVYNVEQYLDECVESVVGQTYENLEIILVDDKSPDYSGKICDDWVKRDSRIKVIHKNKNEGLNMARKTGFESSTGGLIMFLDSDDSLAKICIERLSDLLLDNGVDIAIGGSVRFSEEKELTELLLKDVNTEKAGKKNSPNNIHVRVISDRNTIFRGLLNGYNDFLSVHSMTAWGKLYRRSIIEQTDWVFSNYSAGEDNFELLQWYNFARHGVIVTDAPLHFYRQNPTSIMNSKRYESISPDGRKLNMFEFLNELFDTEREYLKGSELDFDLVAWFHAATIVRMEQYNERNAISQSDIIAISHNLRKIQDLIVTENIRRIQRENEKLTQELASHLTVKRSAKLLAGNIRRKLQNNK